jgi:adenylate cyclase
VSFAARLDALGIPVTRVTTGITILHPQIYSFSIRWERGKGVDERRFRATPEALRALANSPMAIVYAGGGPVRLKPQAPARPDAFPITADLRAEGITDYVALAVPFADGTFQALTLATTTALGFADADMTLFQAMLPALAVNLEIQALRRTARTLLDTYVGRQAGGRVLAGQIHRGQGEAIDAVIWLNDLRGFTALSEAMPRDRLIELLNDYFGPMVDAVEAAGGEVLKFIGDAMLAIFPTATVGAAAACRQALAAARSARAAMAAQNERRAASALPLIDYGIALHIGDVIYGNIGSSTRLDFTVIGPAVNLAARIESLCGKLGRPLLVSADFVAAAGDAAEALGEFPLKGVGAAQTIFAPIETDATP